MRRKSQSLGSTPSWSCIPRALGGISYPTPSANPSSKAFAHLGELEIKSTSPPSPSVTSDFQVKDGIGFQYRCSYNFARDIHVSLFAQKLCTHGSLTLIQICGPPPGELREARNTRIFAVLQDRTLRDWGQHVRCPEMRRAYV